MIRLHDLVALVIPVRSFLCLDCLIQPNPVGELTEKSDSDNACYLMRILMAFICFQVEAIKLMEEYRCVNGHLLLDGDNSTTNVELHNIQSLESCLQSCVYQMRAQCHLLR